MVVGDLNRLNGFDRLEGDGDFYLVRHGQSAGNRDGRIQGVTDLPLTEQGIEQARQTGTWFRKHNIDLICTSPLLRARLTAETIASALGMDASQVLPKHDLVELETGVFSGRTFKELQSDSPEVYRDFLARSWEAVPGAEAIPTISQRAFDHWNWLVDRSNEGKKQPITVTHYGFLQWLLKTTGAGALTSWFPLMSAGNCGIFHLHVSPRQSVNAGKTCYLEWRLVNHIVHTL